MYRTNVSLDARLFDVLNDEMFIIVNLLLQDF